MGNGIFGILKSFFQPWAELFGKRDEAASSNSRTPNNSKVSKENKTADKSLLQSERALRRAALFSDVEISGDAGKTQKIPNRSERTFPHVYSSDETRDRLIAQMHQCVDWNEPVVDLDPENFGYAGLNAAQQKEYFAWRSEVRAEKYPDTDKVYVRIHAQEILNGCGWKQPEDGFKQLLDLWTNYQERFPDLDAELFDWTFSFSQQHRIDFAPDEYAEIPKETLSVVKDILIERHRQDKPLKLSFSLVAELSTYPLRESKFYKDGNQKLVEEAMPRVIALADALSLKQGGKGILQKYGPRTGRKQRYRIYTKAVHPEGDLWNEVTVKPYMYASQLREYVTVLVRYAENVLRSIHGFRGRLRVENLDASLAEMIEEFLKKEYGKEKENEDVAHEQAKIKLDFDSIDVLRQQSDAVREALEVAEVPEETPEEIPVVRTAAVETPELPEAGGIEEFDIGKLSGAMRDLISALSDVHRKALREILISDNAAERMSKIAEDAMTLPEIMIDEINDMATAEIDDILIDAFGDVPCVLEQYEAELKSAVINGG